MKRDPTAAAPVAKATAVSIAPEELDAVAAAAVEMVSGGADKAIVIDKPIRDILGGDTVGRLPNDLIRM
ncbi:MAG: hypothetical protein IRY87_07695 [Acetobacteraceae bacterium]|nr:hypothetical protein [Acetobacteraceae bacterium]